MQVWDWGSPALSLAHGGRNRTACHRAPGTSNNHVTRGVQGFHASRISTSRAGRPRSNPAAKFGTERLATGGAFSIEPNAKRYLL